MINPFNWSTDTMQTVAILFLLLNQMLDHLTRGR